ncbi:MAG TPA: AI-2E family transporter [Crinalium sp.]
MKLGQWLGFLCLAIALLILWQVRQMLLLIFAAIILATAFNGLVHRLQKMGLRRHIAVPITLGSVLLLVILFVGLIVPPFMNQFFELVRLLPEASTQILAHLEELLDLRPSWLNLELPDTSELARQLQPLIQNLLRNFFAFFSNSLTALVQLLLVLVLTVMLLANPTGYRQAFLMLFPSFYRRRADDILTLCEVQLGNWMGGLVISSSFVAAMSFTGLSILQIKLVLVHALLAGLLNLIPNIGPTLSTVFPLTVALLDAPWKAIAVLILYIVIQQMESYWVTPTVMAQQVSLLPAFTLIAQIFFASFFGFLGLLLALPLAVIAKTWISEALVKDILNRWGEENAIAPAALPSEDEPVEQGEG